MKVRDHKDWPPSWGKDSHIAGPMGNGGGILIAVRPDLTARSLTLIMEDEAGRQSAVLDGDVPMLSALSLLLDWNVGRPLAKIGGLELSP